MHYVHRTEGPEESCEEPEISSTEVPVRSEEPAARRLEAFPRKTDTPLESASEPLVPVTRIHQALVTPEERAIPRADIPHVGIPAKLNSLSKGNPNGIPG
jgi:hypothetical protein